MPPSQLLDKGGQADKTCYALLEHYFCSVQHNVCHVIALYRGTGVLTLISTGTAYTPAAHRCGTRCYPTQKMCRAAPGLAIALLQSCSLSDFTQAPKARAPTSAELVNLSRQFCLTQALSCAISLTSVTTSKLTGLQVHTALH